MDGQKVITFPALSQDRQPGVSRPPVDEPRPEGRFADLRSFGEFLRSEREKRKIPLSHIAEQTKVIVSRFESLERGDVGQMPGGIYRRATVRSYALAIGLDPDEIVAEFQKLVEEKETPLPAPAQPQPEAHAVRFRVPRSMAPIAAGIVVGASTATLLLWPAATVPRPQLEEHRSASNQASVAAPAAAVPAVRQEQAPAGDVHLASNDLTNPPPAPRPVENTLRVTSNPSGARVTVNGIGWGSTPLTIRHLPPGTKRVRVSKDGFRSAETTVALDDRGPASVRLSLRPFDGY